MNEAAHPLNRPLPHDVATGESAFIQFYQAYAVFSWPWAWRRTVIFGSIGLLAGISFGVSHGLFVKDVWDGIAVSLASAAANIALIGTGPIVAAFVRQRAWPRRIEAILVVAAVIGGAVFAAHASDWSNHYHDSRMASHGYPASGGGMRPSSDMHIWVRRALDLGWSALILLVANGAMALPAYFSEPRRWAEHRRRVEVERLSLRRTEADMRLTLLQAQVEPHFLFNTLASVRSLVASDPQRAAQTIDALARHLRAMLPKLRAEPGASTTLGEQFAICESYLDLMKVRLGDRLRHELRLPPDLSETPFPPLLLISLVENAIKHGVEPKPGTTQVVLSARLLESKEAPRLEVLVEDDGAGLQAGMGEGTGVANIRAQLLVRYGSAASLELSGRNPGGVLARLVIPLEARGS